MKKVYKHILFIFMSFILAVFVHAQEPEHREFDAQKIEEYRKQSDYQYGEKVRFSLWDMITDFFEKLARLSEYKSNRSANYDLNGPSWVDVLVWVTAILAIIGVLYIVFKGNWAWLFSKGKKNKDGEAYEVLDEDIHNINFTDEIELAVQEKNYRKATRLFYLKSLKLLSDGGYIVWKINKTNTDYRREIKNRDIRDEFDHLSFTFEYVWYGEFELTEEAFQQNFERFRRFNKRFQNTAV